MKNKGRLGKWLCAVCMVMMLAVVSSGVTVKAETLTEGDYQYEVLQDDTVSITKYTGTATQCTIPDSIRSSIV